MRHVVAALVMARTATPTTGTEEQVSATPALPEEAPVVQTARRHRILVWKRVLSPSEGKATHARG